jgi:hypothetical protein
MDSIARREVCPEWTLHIGRRRTPLAHTSQLRIPLPSVTYALEVSFPKPQDVGVVKQMAEILWHGHRCRHPGTPTWRHQTQDKAEAAVSLATILLLWLSTGVIQTR